MFLRGLRWSKVKICVTTTIYTHTGGLIRLYIVIWSVLSQFKWLLLFLHHAWRGHGARLSIRKKDPNNHSDTETGLCLRICDLLVLHWENLPLVSIRGTDCLIRNTFCQWWQSFLRPRSDRRCRSQSRRCNVSSPPDGPGNLRHDVYSSQLEIEINWYLFQLLP